MDVKNARTAQGEDTREVLCREARKLFTRKGYGEASTDEIVRRAGVTKGALYHHFANKQGLYRAVVEALEAELVRRIQAAAESESDPWARLEAMCGAYLDACLEPPFARILVLEAPAVLGWRLWCEIARGQEIAAFAACLRDVIASGRARADRAETMAQVLLGALNTAARVIASADRPARARAQVDETIAQLLTGLGSTASAR